MTVDMRIHNQDALPPLRLEKSVVVWSHAENPMPRIGRILCVLAALALPALGIAVADTVHRTSGTGASQAAAPVNPSDGAAAPVRAVLPARALKAARTALHAAGHTEIQS